MLKKGYLAKSVKMTKMDALAQAPHFKELSKDLLVQGQNDIHTKMCKRLPWGLVGIGGGR